MELTAKTLQEVTFGSTKMRGYNPAEVDQFIEAVAEGVEELRERLRRAVERATRAEAALAAAQAAGPTAGAVAPVPVPVSPSAPPAGQPDISKVWERAVAAAEQAVAEARQEADAMVAEARSQVVAQTSAANQEAASTVAGAKSEADSIVTTAQAEGLRISEESQSQLRRDIDSLDAARNVLKGDVDRLKNFLEEEKQRLHGHLSSALASIENYGTDPDAAPNLSSHSVPDAPKEVPAATPFYGTTVDTGPAAVESAPSDSAIPQWTPPPAAAPLDAPQYSSESVTPETEQQNWSQSEWSAPEEPAVAEASPETSWGDNTETAWGQPESAEPEPPQISWGDDESTAAEQVADNGAFGDAGTGESEIAAAPAPEGDPFLAELRRAVQDEGPLGPREEGVEDPLDNLYANEDDDKSGFFRRKK